MNDKNSSYSWSVKIEESFWTGFGLVDLLQLEKKEFFFNSKKDNGTFIVCNNGYTWNENNEKENNKFPLDPFTKKNSTIKFTYIPSKKTLEYKITSFNGEQKGSLTDVHPKAENSVLYPCLVFLNENTSASFGEFKREK